MKNLICVHQVGKVGSTSVFKTLQHLLPGETIHQTHRLSEGGILGSIRKWSDFLKRAPAAKLPPNLISSIEVSRFLERKCSKNNWYLLSLVREPIGRNVSAMFQNLNRVWMDRLSAAQRAFCRDLLERRSDAAPDADLMRETAQALAALFLEKYPREFVDSWFDQEMKAVFGIDVFSEPFDRDRGYHIYRDGTVRLLMLRLEDLARAFEPGMREWLRDSPWEHALPEGSGLELQRANDGGNKNYALLYKEFLKQLVFDPSFVEREYASRTARHFYSDEERARFTARWTRSESSPALESIK